MRRNGGTWGGRKEGEEGEKQGGREEDKEGEITLKRSLILCSKYQTEKGPI